MAQRVYFHHPRYEVTTDFIRAASRGIKLANIENTYLRRPYMIGALPVAGACAGFILTWADLLYFGEIALLIGVAAGSVFAGSRIGVLYFQSKLLGVSSGSTTWSYPVLKKMQLAVHKALHDRQDTMAGGAVTDVADTDQSDGGEADADSDHGADDDG